MVDYNLQVPGIQPTQAQQFNPLQMIPMLQQQQLNNMLIQERARDLQETNALRQYLRDPNLDLTSRQGMLGALSVAPKAGAPVIGAAATASREARTAETQQAQTAKTRLEALGQTVEFGRKSLAAIDPSDRPGYAQWLAVMGPHAKQLGYALPSASDWNARTKTGLLTTIETFNEQLKEERAGREVEYVPGPNGSVQARFKKLAPGQVPLQVPVGQAPPGTTAPSTAPFVGNPAEGVPSFPVPPNRMADINRRTALYGGVPGQIAPAGEPPNALVQSDTFRAQQPALPRSPTGEKFPNRAEFVPARGATTAEEAEAKKRGELTALAPEKERERIEAAAKARAGVAGQLATLDDALDSTRQLFVLPRSAKDAITGLSARFSSFSKEARDAETKLNNLKGAMTAVGRSLASAEGKLGNMAVQEWKIVTDQVAAMDPANMDPDILDKQLKLVYGKIQNITERLREGYSLEHDAALKKDPKLALPSLRNPRELTIQKAPATGKEAAPGAVSVSPETQRLLDKYK